MFYNELNDISNNYYTFNEVFSDKHASLHNITTISTPYAINFAGSRSQSHAVANDGRITTDEGSLIVSGM